MTQPLEPEEQRLAEMTQMMDQLRAADRTKSDFVSMLAHELRGPMTTVMGFASTLEQHGDSLPEQKRKDILRIIVREVERLSRMVNDLLDVSRMEAGAVNYELQPMDLGELIDSTMATHASLHRVHMLDMDVDPDLPKVLGDRDRLSQVLLNLLTNATHYSPDGSTVRVSVHRAGDDEVQISVIDEGIGIAQGDQERIFDKFAMLPKPDWAQKGTGLGLFITRGIVEAHNGRIWVESEPGKGTSFNVTLPTA
jgi:signal transduction histidine kinase